MKRPGKAAKPQRRTTSKRRKPAKAGRKRAAGSTAPLKHRLSEALEQQKATSEILRVIASSPTDVNPVFEAILESASRLCDSKLAAVFRFDGTLIHLAATKNWPAEALADYASRYPMQPDPHLTVGRVVLAKSVVIQEDTLADANYEHTVARAGGWRRMLGVPMVHDGDVIGVIVLAWQKPGLVLPRHVELLQTLATQAVIAVENVRLFGELHESLQQQTASADVLRIISASLGELEPVFSTILQNATRICEARFGTLYRFDGLAFYHAAGHATPDALIEAQKRQGHFVPEPGTLMHRVMHTKAAAHSADYAAESALGLSAKFGGARSTMVVPMLKDNELVGAFAIYRQEVRPFTEKQIALLENFAAQAVIAIENARLLNELRQRTTDLTQSLQELRTAQDRLVQTEKLASLGQLTAGIAHEIKNPLNFVNNFSGVSAELIGELQDTLSRVSVDPETSTEIKELTDTLRGNLEKVVQHGRRADAIVKNMLLLSGQNSGERSATDINALVEESLHRAYYNARAETRGFTIKLERSFDPAAGAVDLFPKEMTRALLNLISNGFYAATKGNAKTRTHEPALAAATRNLGDRVEIRIRDNGTGIPPEVRDRMFNPFFTTKPAGEGIGLGLTISHDIIVKQHAGSIEVETQPDEFTEIKVILPRAAP